MWAICPSQYGSHLQLFGGSVGAPHTMGNAQQIHHCRYNVCRSMLFAQKSRQQCSRNINLATTVSTTSALVYSTHNVTIMLENNSYVRCVYIQLLFTASGRSVKLTSEIQLRNNRICYTKEPISLHLGKHVTINNIYRTILVNKSYFSWLDPVVNRRKIKIKLAFFNKKHQNIYWIISLELFWQWSLERKSVNNVYSRDKPPPNKTITTVDILNVLNWGRINRCR